MCQNLVDVTCEAYKKQVHGSSLDEAHLYYRKSNPTIWCNIVVNIQAILGFEFCRHKYMMKGHFMQFVTIVAKYERLRV